MVKKCTIPKSRHPADKPRDDGGFTPSLVNQCQTLYDFDIMEKSLLEILACPLCKGGLSYDDVNQELICRFDKLAFPVVNDIPVMIETRARKMDEW